MKHIIEMTKKAFQMEITQQKVLRNELSRYFGVSVMGSVNIVEEKDNIRFAVYMIDEFKNTNFTIRKDYDPYLLEMHLIKIGKDINREELMTFTQVRNKYGHFLGNYQPARFDRVKRIRQLMEALDRELYEHWEETINATGSEESDESINAVEAYENFENWRDNAIIEEA